MKVKSWLASIFLIAITTAAWGQQSTGSGARRATARCGPARCAQARRRAVAAGRHAADPDRTEQGGKTQLCGFGIECRRKGHIQRFGREQQCGADPASCTIRYHWWSSIHGAVVNDDDVSLSLRDAKGVWTMSNTSC